MFPSLLPIDGHACLDRRLWKIARLTPVFLWFCPSMCVFWACSERYRAAWQTGQQRSEHALNHKKTSKSQKLFARLLNARPTNARLFTKWARLKNWEHCEAHSRICLMDPLHCGWAVFQHIMVRLYFNTLWLDTVQWTASQKFSFSMTPYLHHYQIDTYRVSQKKLPFWIF